jgi:hypothetical protein
MEWWACFVVGEVKSEKQKTLLFFEQGLRKNRIQLYLSGLVPSRLLGSCVGPSITYIHRHFTSECFTVEFKEWF